MDFQIDLKNDAVKQQFKQEFKQPELHYKNAIPLPAIFYQDARYNTLRRAKLMIFGECLNKYDNFSQLTYDKQIEIIRQIENSCLSEAIRKAGENSVQTVWDDVQMQFIYHGICFNLISILDDEMVASDLSHKPPSLVNKIINAEIDLKKIANMPAKQLCPEKFADLTAQVEARANIETNKRYSEMYYCHKCKSNKSVISKRMNRSLDEAVNITITCINCGNSRNG